MRLLTITAASDEENLHSWMNVFEQRCDESDEPFNPGEVSKDLKRWQEQNRKKNKQIKKNPLEYQTAEDLHEAMAETRTDAEKMEEYDSLRASGTTEAGVYGLYSLYKLTTAPALNWASLNGSHWCTQDLEEAEDQMDARGICYVMTKGGSLALIFPSVLDVWWYNDQELTGHSSYDDQNPHSTVIPKKDFKALNFFLKNLLRMRELPLKGSKYYVVE